MSHFTFYQVRKRGNRYGEKIKVDRTSGIVVSSTPATTFMIGWEIEKVLQRAKDKEFYVWPTRAPSNEACFTCSRPTEAERRVAKTKG